MPYLPDERQYRTFAVSNFQPVEREAGDETSEPSYVVRGHYTTFNTEYELCPGFFEAVDERALDNANTSDVIFQLNHEGAPLARQRNGSLRVGVDEIGGWAEADLSGSRQGRDIYEMIKNGLIVEMSFGFTIAKGGFEWEEDEDGNIHSRITAVDRVYDVSCVSLPANPNTDISARAYLDGAIEAKQKQQEMLQRAEEERIAEEQRRIAMRRRAAAALKLVSLR